MKRTMGTILLVFACRGTYGQSADARPAFEVASVKVAMLDTVGGSRGGMRGGPGTADPTHFVSSNMSMATLLMRAYEVKRVQLSGPGWLDTQTFNVDARVPPGATPAQFRLMLQNLLVERFKLALHHEDKEMPIYELVVAKNGPKLKAAATEDGSTAAPSAPMHAVDKDGYPVFQPGENGTTVVNFRARMHHPQMSVEQLAVELSGAVGRPVRDATGLKGTYEIGLTWVPDRAPDDVSGPSLLSALQDQLGLKLEQKKGPVDTVVIDHIERVPTEN
ncbi:MAG: TIGR03435 family protein [Acidobacteriia bacterium]|nr:TIGR03435 family protein [Terriglobia bacterium]